MQPRMINIQYMYLFCSISITSCMNVHVMLDKSSVYPGFVMYMLYNLQCIWDL